MNYLRDVVHNMVAGCRLALMLPVRRDSFRLGIDQAVLLLLASFVLWLGYSFLITDPKREFNAYGLSHTASIYLLFLFSVYLIARIQGIPWAAGTLLVILLTGWLATHIGKRRTFMITISISLVGYALKWVGYNPDHPYWLLFAAPLVAFGVGSLFTLMGSMISDVCDHDELETGQRREGVFGAIYWWMVKIGFSIAALAGGYLLEASGYDVALPAQSETTLVWLRLFDVAAPLITSVIAIAIMATYPITEQRAYEIRAELERRRGKLA